MESEYKEQEFTSMKQIRERQMRGWDGGLKRIALHCNMFAATDLEVCVLMRAIKQHCRQLWIDVDIVVNSPLMIDVSRLIIFFLTPT